MLEFMDQLRVGKRSALTAIPSDRVPDDQEIRDLDATEEVIFVGYPFGLSDRENFIPIIRRGITATPTATRLRGQTLLLDRRFCLPGVEWSPVFIYQRGAVPTRAGIALGSRVYFLGLITDALKTELRDRDPRLFLNLGLVVKAAVVKELAEACKSGGCH